MGMNFKDESEVKEFIKNLGIEYRFGCYKEKKAEVCHLLGDYFEAISKSFNEAAKEYKDNCDERNYTGSCRKFGGYSLIGRGTKKDPELALKYYDKGCNLGDSQSCFNQGVLLTKESLGVNLDIPKGLECLKKSCNADNEMACYFISGIYLDGIKKPSSVNKLPAHHPTVDQPKSLEPSDYLIQKDMKEAFKYTKKACELKNFYACVNLSQMYTRGEGIEKNEKLGLEFKKIALELQDEIKQKGIEFQQGLS